MECIFRFYSIGVKPVPLGPEIIFAHAK